MKQRNALAHSFIKRLYEDGVLALSEANKCSDAIRRTDIDELVTLLSNNLQEYKDLLLVARTDLAMAGLPIENTYAIR